MTFEIKLAPGTMTFSAPHWPTRTWLIPDGMVITVTEGPPEPLPAPAATKVAPPIPSREDDPSPLSDEVRRLGGLPGPMQRKVLKALADVYPNGITGKFIARAAGIPEGSVYGCTSGMVRQRGRWWVAFNDEGEESPRTRFWFITERGREALALLPSRND